MNIAVKVIINNRYMNYNLFFIKSFSGMFLMISIILQSNLV